MLATARQAVTAINGSEDEQKKRGAGQWRAANGTGALRNGVVLALGAAMCPVEGKAPPRIPQIVKPNECSTRRGGATPEGDVARPTAEASIQSSRSGRAVSTAAKPPAPPELTVLRPHVLTCGNRQMGTIWEHRARSLAAQRPGGAAARAALPRLPAPKAKRGLEPTDKPGARSHTSRGVRLSSPDVRSPSIPLRAMVPGPNRLCRPQGPRFSPGQ